MTDQTKNIPETKLILHKQYLVKPQEETIGHYIGYDILSESLVKIPKKDSIELPQAVYEILQNEGTRVKIASAICKTRIGAAMFLKTTERTIYRWMKTYKLPQRKLIVKQQK